MKDITQLHEFHVCGWDTTHLTASRPIRQPLYQGVSVTQINPDASYILADRVKIRKERFGCFVQYRDNYTIRAYDQDGYNFLLSLRQAIKGKELLNKIAQSDKKLILNLISEGLIRCVEDNHHDISDAEFFAFEDLELPVSNSPMSIEAEITRKCNRHCTYCAYNASPKVNQNEEMGTEFWANVVGEAASLGVMTMEFTGGDPLTRSDWLETLQKVESLGILFTINSDLTRLKDETIRLLTTFRNLISVQTTLDGASATQHDFYRGSGSFAKTIDGALRLSEAGVPVHAGMIISKENYSSVRKVAELCPKSGIKALYIGSLYAAGRGVNLVNSVPSNDQLGEAARAYCQAIHENIIQPVHPVMYRAVERYLADKKHFNYLKDHPYMVKPGIYDFRVDPKGICYTSIKLEGTSLYNIGDLNNESLSDVWRKSGGINRLRTFCFEQKPNHFRSIDSSPFGGPLALQQAIN